ncbi:amidohydrolase family protein [Yinghuangia seranimata]|uniref:amidohydrolase family protein n=1 Tax=Yinghuangia seranimata TaxID=408067 RepID=UPI00248D1634|nr:amidohydrolase family protein [Yinghuangia seranimata]MDI2125724.1 amidohydrolase family protein [Yinghuangia seranimata]
MTDSPSPRLVLRDVELDGVRRCDVAIADGRIAEISRAPGDIAPTAADELVDGRGGALIWGLADHHTHLHALAAAMASVSCGPPKVTTADALADRLRDALPGADGWVRGVGYHPSVAGELTRDRLDALRPDVPVRIQHRSGALWYVNSAGLRALGLETESASVRPLPPGVGTDRDGRPDGRLWDLDAWLRERIPSRLPDLAEVGCLYASFGVTHLTDATPDLPDDSVRHLGEASRTRSLPQALTLLGLRPGSSVWRETRDGRVHFGASKIHPPDHDPWPYDRLLARVRELRGEEYANAVAIHCVTRESLVLALAALDEAGPPMVGFDRIEHAAVVPVELIPRLAAKRRMVVTQPGFVAERGDAYAAEVDPADLPDLYRYRSLIEAGVRVGLSSDAPYSDPDPWRILRAARDRTTPSGRVLGPDERVTAATALNSLTNRGRPSARPPIPFEAGFVADLCLFHTPLAAALADPRRDLVRMTICAGLIAYTSS